MEPAAPTTAPARSRAGQQLGRYALLRLVGAGGMGEVYGAYDPRLQREVAVKVLPDAFATDADRLRRFEAEARAAGALSHPNVLTVHDVGVDGGVPYLVTELLEGETLRRRLDQGALSPRKAVELARQICEGLAAAHAKGIVHRDVKPANVLVTPEGQAKVLDFGLAKLRTQGSQDDTDAIAGDQTGPETQAGVVLGTLAYLSPEQIRGEELDARSDIFALGSTLYEMLSGRRAFGRPTTAETMHAILNEDVAPLGAGIGVGLESLLRRCLEKRPAERFQSARDLAFALEALAGAPAPLPSAGRPSRRPPPTALALAAALLATGLGAYFAGRRSRVNPEPAYQQLTFRRGAIHAARFAPDGYTIVYGASFEGAPTRVYTTRVEGTASSPLDLPDASLLAVSASGELALAVGYRYSISGGVGALARVPLAGGAPRDVLERVAGADWAPDGASLAVVRSAAGKSRLEFPIGRVLYETHGWISHPRVSPAGDAVAFLDHPGVDQSGSLAVVDASGTVRRLATGLISAMGLAWHPSGREVWFTGARVAIDNAVRAVDLQGRERILLQGPARFVLYDVFKDGRVLLARESLRAEVAARAPGAAAERRVHWLDFSILCDLAPDGSHVLISEGGASAPIDFETYLKGLDESPAVRLGPGLGAQLSPDGKWVLTTSLSGPSKLGLLPTGVGEPTTIEPYEIDRYGPVARWHPDGERILFGGAARGGEMRLHVQSIAGGPPRPFTAGGVRLSSLADPVSPDGAWVTAVGPQGALGLYPLDGGAPQPLASVDPSDRLVRWIEYGRSLYVWRMLERPANIERLDLASGRRTRLASLFPSDPVGVGGLLDVRMTPDGRGYAYWYSRQLDELYLVDGLR